MYMKKLREITKQQVENIKLVMFDCDGVTIPLGTEVHETEEGDFKCLTAKSPMMDPMMKSKLIELSNYFMIGFSSGRGAPFMLDLYRDIIGEGVYVQSENGMFTTYNGYFTKQAIVEPDDYKHLALAREFIEFIKGHENITGFEPKQLLITVHVTDRVHALENYMKDQQNLYCIYHKNEAYDIGIKGIDKGSGLNTLMEGLGLGSDNVLALGNGHNDQPMLDAVDFGVTVDKDTIEGSHYTEKKLHEGAIEIIDFLLEMVEGEQIVKEE